MKLNTTPVTSSQPPQIAANARIRVTGEAEPPAIPAVTGTRARRRDTHSNAPSEISAAGISQLTCPPNSDPNNRKIPVAPPNTPPPPPPPNRPAPPALLALNPIDPVSVPSSRPSPL